MASASTCYQTIGTSYIGYVTAGQKISLKVLNETGARGVISYTPDATFMRIGMLY